MINLAGRKDCDDLIREEAEARFKREQKLEERVAELEKLAKEAVSTCYRFVDSYKGDNAVPTNLACKSAEYHLNKLDEILKDK